MYMFWMKERQKTASQLKVLFLYCKGR